MIYCLTPTGCRPEGLALLGEYLSAQTFTEEITWIVVDDCDPATRVPRVRENITVVYHRPQHRWTPGRSTQLACMAAGLRKVPRGAILVVLEDDDIYLPGHIDNVVLELTDRELVGEAHSYYYNVATRRWSVLLGRGQHASLASTACTGDALELLREMRRS